MKFTPSFLRTWCALAATGALPLLADGNASFATLQAAAAKGDPEAECDLGKAYVSGQDAPQNYAKAADLFRQAALQGSARAMSNLGTMYFKGFGVAADPVVATAWHRTAAEAGFAPALEMYAWELLHGSGVAKDAEQAKSWYRKAADRGSASAQLALGEIAYGALDNAEAAKWYGLAAAQGDVNAENNLGILYENGMGVPRDPARAAKLYTQAAAAGNPKAMTRLGHFYKDGLGGLAADPAEACKWYLLGSRRDKISMHEWGDVRDGFTDAQQAEGERRAAAFTASFSQPKPSPAGGKAPASAASS